MLFDELEGLNESQSFVHRTANGKIVDGNLAYHSLVRMKKELVSVEKSLVK